MTPRKLPRTIRILVYLLPLLALTSCSLGGCGKSKEITVQVGPEGGEFALYGDLTLYVPPQALEEELEITVLEISKNEIDLQGQSDSSRLIAAFDLQPDGATFNLPLELRVEGVEAEPGDLPLVYNLDDQHQITGLAEVRTDFNQEGGTLTLFLDHFSEYAEFIKEDYVSPECLANPCRCEDISIKTYDAYNICSQDDCQVTESNVSITYVSCGGNQETLHMKEISPTCQPKLQVVPEKNRIPTESSTAVWAELKLSCAPFSDQGIDFSVDQLGTVNPVQGISDREGKAQTTFSAGDEEGIATVTAEASGTYHLFEITVNGESEYGETRSYQLTESAEIEIGNIRGHFEGFFDTCRGEWCVHGYQAVVDFVVEEIDWEGGMWYGTMDVTQSGDVSCTAPGNPVTNVIIPQYEDLATWGKAYPESGELDLLHLAVFMIEDADIDVAGVWFSTLGGFMSEDMVVSLDTSGIIPFRFAIDGSDTPQEGTAYIFLPNDEMPTMPGTYTLTLED